MSKDWAALIEPQRLREAIAWARRTNLAANAYNHMPVLVEAAEAHLATLPEPPRLVWKVYVNDGPKAHCLSFDSEDEAIEHARGFLSIPDVRVEVIVRQVKP